MNNRDLSSQGVVVEGPEGLREELERLFEVRQSNSPTFIATQHYIIYTFNTQISLIRVDVSKQPFQLYYGDLKRHPATEAVKKEIGEFIKGRFPQHLEKLRSLEGLNERVALVDLYDLYWRQEKLAASLAGRTAFPSDLSMRDAHDLLSRLKRPEPKPMNVPNLDGASVPVKKQSLFGFFSRSAPSVEKITGVDAGPGKSKNPR